MKKIYIFFTAGESEKLGRQNGGRLKILTKSEVKITFNLLSKMTCFQNSIAVVEFARVLTKFSARRSVLRNNNEKNIGFNIGFNINEFNLNGFAGGLGL